MRSWRRLLPLFLTAMGLQGLAGCFYLPTPEHQADSKQKDFRELIGTRESKRPIRPGAATRESVTALLGPAIYGSKDHRSAAYTLDTVRGVWVNPACFSTQLASQRIYAVRLLFDDNDVLAGWNLVHVDQDVAWFKGVPMGAEKAIEQLNRGTPASAAIEPSSQH